MKKAYKPKLLSVDQVSGTVVLSTRAPDKTEIPVQIDDKSYTGIVTGGQVWIQTGTPFKNTHSIIF
ncbi:hypothetical protein [Tellurirhabdus bombi]|uniref:hypothetical protein n=1 Tax=Tellurirhabdus bombi TaxID=2907205 RepID=UPI001F490191|nr:hypothetical protein [Tellurirhabdus bombi]